MVGHLERIGQVVGDYRLLRWLGGGGFGNVYLAEQTRDGKPVALKILQVRLSRSEDFRAFLNEARTIRLRHPHIMPLLDFGLSREDEPFLVMEYAPKGTLRDRHPRGSHVPLLTVVSYATQVASALQFAHEQHLVHRDVKPENMLMRDDEVILLSDFGIATSTYSTHSVQGQQGIGGTVPYMAPEQLEGKPRPQSDQYALAVVVYEWLAGRCPFQGTAVEVAMQHALQPPPSLRNLVPGLPQEVEAVILRALAKDPKARFASIQDFAAELEHASYPATFRQPVSPSANQQIPQLALPNQETPQPSLSPSSQDEQTDLIAVKEQPASVTPPTRVTQSQNTPTLPSPTIQTGLNRTPSAPVRSNRLWQAIVGSLLVIVLLAVIWGGHSYKSVSPADATATAKVAPTATVSTAAYDNFVKQHGMMFGFDTQHTRNNPYEHLINTANVALLKQAWTASIVSNRASGTGHYGRNDSSPTIANGLVYVGSYDGTLYALDAFTGQQKWTASTGNNISFSPAVANGLVYVGSSDAHLYAFDALTGQQKWTARTGGAINSAPAIANGLVYVGSDDHNLYAFDAMTGQQKWTALTGGNIGSSPAVANGLVYVRSGGTTLYAFDAMTGQQKWTAPVIGSVYYDPSPAIANGLVYVGSNNGTLYAFDALTGKQRWTTTLGSGVSFESSPAIANGLVYLVSYGYFSAGDLYAFDALTGQQKWGVPADKFTQSPPTIANGLVYVGAGELHLYAFDALTGQRKWTTGIANYITSAPAVANGLVYMCASSTLYVFGLS